MNYASLCFLALFLLPLGLIYTDSKPLPPLPVPPFNIPQAEICRYLGLDYCSINLPALYVVGDSIVDAGNNNYLDTASKANYAPYGIDFGGVATGRPTNGRTFVDFIAQVVGLPFPPPVMGLSESQRNITTGLNYGSSSGGNDLVLYWQFGKLPEQFSTAIYELGARKFVVNNAFPFRCQPVNLHQKANKTSVLEDMNERAALFNGFAST
ncbi:GDSL esterase/lipase At5g08460-like [Hibiscus syriacus]|uniref:GDSL esterase/lipase At5g08460-like n=1 Tax=Hibiscus syriacus TaxID=106335 RepID=UPI001922BCA0|nr:GDSL esterase/lipase At5g08460-like [Hibiscus syriacus]